MKKNILIVLLLLAIYNKCFSGDMVRRSTVGLNNHLIKVIDDLDRQVIINTTNPNIVVYYPNEIIDVVCIKYNEIIISIYRKDITIEEVYDFIFFRSEIKNFGETTIKIRIRDEKHK